MHEGIAAATRTDEDLATAEEVAAAVRQLTDADHVRLLKAANLLVAGTAFTDARDLLSEAIATPYLAALGEGGRRWPKHVPFVAFLMMTVRGVASDSRGSADRRRTIRSDLKARGDISDLDILNSTATCHPSVEQVVVDEENASDCQLRDDTTIARVLGYFAEDQEVKAIIDGLREGVSGAEVQQRSGMSKTQYESARRRWRRGLERLFPAGGNHA